MKWIIRSVAVLSLIPVLSEAMRPVHAQHVGWRSEFDDAEQSAKAEKRPLLIHFQAWYCGPCRQMDSQVFAHSDVQRALQTDLIAVQIDVTRESELAARYQASTVPRDVVVYPDGVVETVNVGFVSRSRYLALLRDIAGRGDSIRRGLLANSEDVTRRGSAAQPESTSNPESDASSTVGEADAPIQNRELLLGLEGYCPVRLSRDRQWVEGRQDLTEEYRGVKYRFASESDLAAFQENPGRYAPQNLGCDPVILLDSQRAVAGKIQYGAFFDQQLYLFNTLENKAEFRRNPLKFTRIRHAVRPENIVGSRFQ